MNFFLLILIYLFRLPNGQLLKMYKFRVKYTEEALNRPIPIKHKIRITHINYQKKKRIVRKRNCMQKRKFPLRHYFNVRMKTDLRNLTHTYFRFCSAY